MKLESSKLNKELRKGFGVIEIIVACVIIGIVVSSLVEVGVLSLRLSLLASHRVETVFLLQEGIEAMKLLRDRSWNTNIAPLSLGAPYYLSFDGSNYNLAAAPSPLINGVFQRTVMISAVKRNGSGDIDAAGSTDPSTKKVTIEVLWQEQTGTSTEAVDFYITDLFQN